MPQIRLQFKFVFLWGSLFCNPLCVLTPFSDWLGSYLTVNIWGDHMFLIHIQRREDGISYQQVKSIIPGLPYNWSKVGLLLTINSIWSAWVFSPRVWIYITSKQWWITFVPCWVVVFDPCNLKMRITHSPTGWIRGDQNNPHPNSIKLKIH